MNLHGKTALLTAVAALIVAGGASASTGLSGAYYAFSSWPGTIANTQALIADFGAPTATFTTDQVCFPTCGGTIGDDSSLTSFLGGNYSNFAGTDVSSLSDHGLLLAGFVDVASNGTYSFSLGSDDGSALWIDGTEVINNDGDHGFNTITDSSVTLSAGLHSIEVLQFEDGGVTGLTFTQNAGTLVSGVPEPATWSFMIAGFGLMGFGLRQRRRADGLLADRAAV